MVGEPQDWKRLADEGIRADFGNEWLHVGAVKGFADGSVGSGTAWFLKAYSDNPKDCGGPVVDLDGRCIGINIARALRVATYALPASVAKETIEKLRGGAVQTSAPQK